MKRYDWGHRILQMIWQVGYLYDTTMRRFKRAEVVLRDWFVFCLVSFDSITILLLCDWDDIVTR